MKYDLEHDWQGNMSTPRKNLGDKTKFNLFIALAIIWATFGLIGHDPWAPQESKTISQIVTIIYNDKTDSLKLYQNFVVPKNRANPGNSASAISHSVHQKSP